MRLATASANLLGGFLWRRLGLIGLVGNAPLLIGFMRPGGCLIMHVRYGSHAQREDKGRNLLTGGRPIVISLSEKRGA